MAKKKYKASPPTATKPMPGGEASSAKSAPQMVVKNIDSRKLPHVANNNLPTIWVDAARLFFRTDQTGAVRLFTMVEDSFVESARIHGHKEFWRGLIDALAATINYYPTKDSAKLQPLEPKTQGGKPE